MAPQHNPILVVDDDEDIRDAMRGLLEEEGYAVLLAANGREALDRLRAHGPACLIVLDLMMPVMDGEAFMAEQAADPALSAIPVVVVTAAGRHQLGGIDRPVLRKPITANQLLDVIQQYC